MDALLKILAADEKKIDILTARLNQLKKNITNETKADSEVRKTLSSNIAAMKKTNSAIVDHCLKENILAQSEIDEIVKTHLAEKK